jgi:chromosome segregation ATPase
MDTVAQIRAETAARIAQTETVLQQTRADMAKQLTEARQRFEAERQRGEASEARLLAMLDQIRTEQKVERQAFTTERQDWNHQETLWREQHEAQQRENAELRANLTAAGERQNALTDELGQLRLLLRDAEARHLETVREAEGLRGELKAVQADRTRLQRQLDALPPASPDQVRTPASD